MNSALSSSDHAIDDVGTAEQRPGRSPSTASVRSGISAARKPRPASAEMNGLARSSMIDVQQDQDAHAGGEHDLGRERVPVDRGRRALGRRRRAERAWPARRSAPDRRADELRPRGWSRRTSGRAGSRTRRCRMSSGVHAIHSDGFTSLMCGSLANSSVGRAERGALEQPQQVAGGEHRAERGDAPCRCGTAPRSGPRPGCRRRGSRGTRPRTRRGRAGRATPWCRSRGSSPSCGAWISRPPSRLISSVW